MFLFRSAAVKTWSASAKQVQLLQQQCGRTGLPLQQPRQGYSLTLGHNIHLTVSDVRILLGSKVPLQFASAVCGPLETEYHAIACHGAATLLEGLLTAIQRAQVETSLQEGLSQQLQQSGLLQQLPALMSAAQHLLAARTQAIVTAHTSTAATDPATQAGSHLSDIAVLHVCFSLVHLMQRLSYMREPVVKNWVWDGAGTSAAVGLAVSALQHLHLMMKYQGIRPHGAYNRVRAFHLWGYLITILSRPIIWKQHLTPAVAAAGLGIVTMAGCISQHMKKLGLRAPITEFDPDAATEWCWRLAGRPSEGGLVLPTHLVLPPHLEQLLGCDNRTLRWLAASIFVDLEAGGFNETVESVADLARGVSHAAGDLRLQQQQVQQQPQQHCELELYMRLNSLLMALVAQDPLHEKRSVRHYFVLESARTIMSAYKCCCWPDSAKLTSGDSAHTAAVAAAKSGIVPMEPVLHWMQVALPSLLVCAAQLSQQLCTGPPSSKAAGDESPVDATAAAAAAAAAGSTHSTASGDGGVAGLPAAAAAAAAAAATRILPGSNMLTLCEVTDMLVNVLKLQLVCTAAPDQPVPKVWCASYQQLCSVFEGLVRAMTATVQAAAAVEDKDAITEIVQVAQQVGIVLQLYCSKDFGVLSQSAFEAPPDQHQDRLLLFSLQCSLLKLCSSLRSHEQSRTDLAGTGSVFSSTAGSFLLRDVT